ncbi:flagellar hook-associated protein FlgK [Limnochorda pilosa]|uniref:Flagellar hook-associated protein 1 n=1 Tax=Limnochorda pilosa TaxID=1555112 RepID=A0A0K2SNT3_LIMPI|nr:flagellar hook-associated protein FlgK [Limnochorda pilosa]BAS28798.1 flagellar hook-associated protein FlgK [Limnochorda pilosa]
MAGTFLGIEIAKRALMAHQRSLDVTSHNVGNANTPGYTRQVGILQATPPIDAWPEGQVGTGVNVTQIRRMHDAFTQIQLLQEDSTLGYWEQIAGGVGQVERFLMEPTESGIGQALDWFWEAWNELSKRPESIPEREVVLERARGVADAFRHTRQQLHELRVDLDRQIRVQVDEVNTLADRIAQTNKEIAKVVRLGQQPNDLMDKRDQLLRDLSQVVGFTIEDGRDGQINVRMGDHMLVDEDRAYVLQVVNVTQDGASGFVDPPLQAARVEWVADSQQLAQPGSKLGAMVELRDSRIVQWIKDLDALARDLITAVNNLHNDASNPNTYDLNDNAGGDFFSGASALDIGLALTTPEEIAAADALGEPGNGNVAAAIAALANVDLPTLGMTPDESVEALLARVGSLGQEAQVRVDSQEVLMNHLENQRAAVSGVSLDEELTNMLRFEHAYSASSRVLTAVDSMLEQLITRTGRVGL